MTIDAGKLKISTKALASAFMLFGALMQIDVVKQFVLQLTAHHPHIASIVTAAIGVYAILHNPLVEQTLGIKQTVETKTEEVTLKP